VKKIAVGIFVFGAIVIIVLLLKDDFGGFKMRAGKDGVQVEVESTNKQTPQSTTSPTQIVNVGLNEEAIKKEFENLKREILQSLDSGKPESQEEVIALKQKLKRVEAKLANTQKALEERKNVLAETEKALESEQIKNAVPEDQLAQAQYKLEEGDSSQAETIFNQILQEAEAKAEAGAEAAFQLANFAKERVDYLEALKLFEKAVQFAPENSFYLNEAGVMLDILAHYDKAIGYYKKALASDLETYGTDHPSVAILWNNLGAAWKSKGEYDKAIGYYEKALASNLKTHGPDHPRVATYWNNLGGAWDSKGEYDKAIEYYERALTSDLKTYGANHPSVARLWNNLGLAWRSKGEYNKAIEYYENALQVVEKAGLQHRIELVKRNIAVLKKKAGRE